MKTLITILTVLFCCIGLEAQETAAVTGKIISENNEGQVKIKAAAISNSQTFADMNFILITLKKGKSGTSSNKQSGKFSLKPNETRILSETYVNLAEKDGLKVYLFLKDEESDRTIAKDSLEINPQQFTAAVTYIPEKDLELAGLTIDETKTRMGQMFYEIFFKKYNQIPEKYDGTVIITELPSFGRNSRITVTVDDRIIYSFLSKPDEEAVEAEALTALNYLADFTANQNLRDREFKY
ncbi:curli-like amyloid fiber formation chaperone CsgH [Chryseobacterium sp.]|uniref:curli-like amyloid fiber formation chaperone CsgH n=1 Tax=Chryseobacterium sp. TaxID=1871047 RepID=UPI0012A78C9A|nr:curli-like amyloid fiber formation chaperone CsgH [Chryseobacterium sp.]QFG53586.1 hypothetical protein F7R58_08500 [Chryseobacterium sp.]